ncbi:MAG: DUF4392 domain-containing protein [Planctomycetota bacterium]
MPSPSFQALEDILLFDPGKRGIAPLVQRGALESAARQLLEKSVVAVVTGFYIPSAKAPETDGPLGAVHLRDALQANGQSVTLITDDRCHSRLQTLGFSKLIGSHWSELPSELGALVSIERLGRALDGHYYNMRGVDITDRTAPLDELFLQAADAGVLTIGVGDGGNEIGMGNVRGLVSTHISQGERIGSTIPVDHLIVAGVSNWGAWGLVAGISMLAEKNLMPAASKAREDLERLVDAGVVDGVTGRAEPTVDGLDWDVHAEVLDRLTAVVRWACP